MTTNLTQVSITARRIIRYGVFLIIILIIGKFTFDIGHGIFRYFFPKPLPPPTVGFGRLPKLPFPEGEKTEGITFTAETPEGGLPTLTTQAKVFFMPQPSANLLSLDAAKERASDLGFDGGSPEEVSQTTYRFKHKSVSATIEINIVTGVFSLNYDLSADSSLLQRRPPIPEVAASETRAYLSSASLLPEDLTGKTTNEFLRPKEGKLSPVLSLADSNFVKINFFRKDYNELPVVTPKSDQSNVWFILSGSTEREKQFIGGEYHYFPVDESKFETYPVKTAETVWQELTTQEVYVVDVGSNKEGDNVKIRRIYLAYFDAGVPTEFLQPVVVFEGDGNFVAYVPAVTPDYYGE